MCALKIALAAEVTKPNSTASFYTDGTPAADPAFVLIKRIANARFSRLLLTTPQGQQDLKDFFSLRYTEANGDSLYQYTGQLDFDSLTKETRFDLIIEQLPDNGSSAIQQSLQINLQTAASLNQGSEQTIVVDRLNETIDPVLLSIRAPLDIRATDLKILLINPDNSSQDITSLFSLARNNSG